MKYTLPSLLLLLLSTGLFAQSEFAPAGSVWHFQYDDWILWQNTHQYGIQTIEYTDDVLVDGILCKNLSGYYVYQQGKKVFYKDPMEQGFHLLYDFSVLPGGQFQTGGAIGTNMTVKVVSSKADTLLGQPMTVFEGFMICNWGNGFSDSMAITYNDRFGATNQFLFYPSVNCLLDYLRRYTFRCFEDSTLGLFNPSGVPCTQISAVWEAGEVSSLLVTPNPADQRVRLTLPAHTGPLMLTVRDLLGGLVMQQSFGVGESYGDIGVSKWPSACYSALLTDDAGQPVGTARIVVAR